MCRIVVVDFGDEIDWMLMKDGTIYVDYAHYDDLIKFIDSAS